MDNFGYVRAGSVEEALQALGRIEGSRVLAGGTDLIPLLKEEIVAAPALVDITTWPDSTEIEPRSGGLHIGALASLSSIAADETVRRSYPALAEACSLAATPQLRNMSTIAGNLLQQTRCWYYRGPFNCWLKGGSTCFARDGENENHSIYLTGPQESRCVSAHPSDPAAALLALGAQVILRGDSGERTLPIEELYALPDQTRRTFVALPQSTLITGVALPPSTPGDRSVYLKAMPRATWAFALAGVAIYLQGEGSRISAARVALSGVAPIPIRVKEVEEALTGSDADTTDADRLAETLVAAARPLSQNGYKVPLLRSLFKDALQQVLAR